MTEEWNTAKYQNEAAACEARLEWGRAADLWQAAMDNYPRPENRPIGDLAKADLSAMERRMQACLAMYFPA